MATDELLQRYRALKKQIEDFDAKNEPKRLALITLGRALEGGWDSVRIAEMNDGVSAAQQIRPDYAPVNVAALNSGEGVSTIIATRAGLEEQLNAVIALLPPEFRPIRAAQIRPDAM